MGERGGSWAATYEDVQARIDKFRSDRPDWPMTTQVTFRDGAVVAHTIIGPAGLVIADGWALEELGSPYAVENAETSARGRALVNLGYPPKKSDTRVRPPGVSAPGKRAGTAARTPAEGEEAVDLEALRDDLADRLSALDDEARTRVERLSRLGLPLDPAQMNEGQIRRVMAEIDKKEEPPRRPVRYSTRGSN